MGAEKTRASQLEALGTKELAESFVAPTAKEEAAVIRKLDKRLLPLVFLLYTLAQLDRSNIGNAKLAGFPDDYVSGDHYLWLGTIFYISYIISQGLAVGWKQFRPHRWAALCVLFWGFVASIQAATNTWGGMMACRFFLGVSEAMFGPGVPLYLSFFYPRDKVGFRQGVFISGAAAANVYGGVLAYGITQIKGTLAAWRILFLVEGLPTIACAILAWYFFPDSIREARFLTPREKDIALYMTSKGQKVDVEQEHGLRLKETWDGIKDPISWIPALCFFGCNVSFASLPLFLPTIISEIGTFNPVQAQGLSAPPYVLSFCTIIGFCWFSDKLRLRGPFCAAAAILGAIGFIINATCTGAAPRYFATFLSVEIFASVAILLSWVSNLNATESRRAGANVVLQTVGQCGPILGTRLFPDSERPQYAKGMWISAAFCLLVAVLSGGLSTYLHLQNKKMEREGVPRMDSTDGSSGDGVDGPQPRPRYIL